MRGPKLIRTAGIILTLLAVARPGGGAAAVTESSFASVSAERVTSQAAPLNPEAFQFLRADARGRLYLLRGDTLAVDLVQPSGKVTSAAKPPAEPVSDERVITDAALSPDGDRWLLLIGHERLAVLKEEKLRALPAPVWVVSALAFTGDGPVVAVLPVQETSGEEATTPPARASFDKPPLLLGLDEQKGQWQTLVAGKVFERRDSRVPVPLEIRAERASIVTTGAKGSLWLAQQSAYALKQFSRAGKLEASLAVSGGSVQWKDRTEDDWKRLEKSAASSGMKVQRSQLGNLQATRVVRALTVDGSRVYLVIETPAGLALDRWDGVTQSLDRVQLANITASPSRLSVAAAHDGLYLAGGHLGEPVWRLDWQRLEEAKWKPVPNAVAEGAAAAGRHAGAGGP